MTRLHARPGFAFLSAADQRERSAPGGFGFPPRSGRREQVAADENWGSGRNLDVAQRSQPES